MSYVAEDSAFVQIAGINRGAAHGAEARSVQWTRTAGSRDLAWQPGIASIRYP